MESIYLTSSIKQFEYYKILGEKTFDQLSEDDIFWQFNEESNSIAIIVNHVAGNMKSRWTNFLSEDGEKSWRNRDREFENVITSKSEMITRWNEGWKTLFEALESINEENFNQPIYIRKQKHHIIEAVNRQMMHYAYHIGQIVYLGRMIKGSEWKNLSVPKGESAAFNAKKMARGIHGGHFTDDIK